MRKRPEREIAAVVKKAEIDNDEGNTGNKGDKI